MTITAALNGTPQRPLYERMEGETDAAFHAFCLYRDLGPTRSLQKVGTHLQQERLREAAGGRNAILLVDSDEPAQPRPEDRSGHSPSGHIKRLSREWNWSERATAWD